MTERERKLLARVAGLCRQVETLTQNVKDANYRSRRLAEKVVDLEAQLRERPE